MDLKNVELKNKITFIFKKCLIKTLLINKEKYSHTVKQLSNQITKSLEGLLEVKHSWTFRK